MLRQINQYSCPRPSICQGKDGLRWRNKRSVCRAVDKRQIISKVWNAGTRRWCEDGTTPARLPLCLCDFSQSRLLINFQIVNVKVIVAPFHRGADKPASINIPVSGCRSGWYDIHGLIPSLLYRCCHRHVNFSPGGSRMPSKSAYSTAGEMLFNCLLRRGTGRQCAITPAGLWRIEGGDKTVLKSCNFSTAWRRLFAPILVNNAWRVLNAPVSKDCSLPSAHFVLLGFPRKDNCRLSDVNICLLTPIIPHNLGLGVFGLCLD